MLLWVNGELVPDTEARVSAFDHGLTVGDGVFETIKVVAGTPFALTRHLDRLAASALGLGLPVPPHETLRGAVEEVLAANAVPDARLRITLTGGVGPLGSERGGTGPTLILGIAALPPRAATTTVVTVPWTRNERGALAGLKTTSYAENVVALARARAAGATEALFANTRGELCEGTGSNVFVVLDGRLLTPPLTSGCLAGVTRALVMEWVGAEETDLPLAALGSAGEVFLTSTTRDVQAVAGIDGRPVAGAPGPVTRKAMDVFAERAAADLDP